MSGFIRINRVNKCNIGWCKAFKLACKYCGVFCSTASLPGLGC